MKPGLCRGPSPFLCSVVLVGRLSPSSWNVTFPHSPARTECSYIVGLCIWPDQVRRNTTDVFSCLRTRRKMHSFILFPSASPQHRALSVCLWNVTVVYCLHLRRRCLRHETIFKYFYFTHHCPSHPTPPSLPERCDISKPALWFAFSSFTLAHVKTPMWAKCHCGVGKFSWLNWNALSRHRWVGRKTRIKRTDYSFRVWTPDRLWASHNSTNLFSFSSVSSLLLGWILLASAMWSLSLQKRARGQYLFFKVCEHLNLMEKDYFGLTYRDSHDQKVCIHACAHTHTQRMHCCSHLKTAAKCV